MAESNTPTMIYTTWPDVETAQAAGRALVMEKLAACVNILAPATAIYEWEGAAQHDTEHPMLIKTVAGHIDAVSAAVKRLHPYDVPAVVALDITGGDAAFLNWIGEQTMATGNTGTCNNESE